MAQVSRVLIFVRPFCGMNLWDRLLLALTVVMLVAALVVWLG